MSASIRPEPGKRIDVLDQSGVDEVTILHEKIAHYARLLPFLVFSAWLGGVGIVVLSWGKGAHQAIVYWSLAYCAHLAYRFYHYLRSVRGSDDLDYQSERFDQIVSGVISGSLWGWAPLLFGDIGFENRLIIYWLVCTFCGVGAMVSGFNPIAYGMGVVTAVVPVVAHLLFLGTTQDRAIAVMIAIATAIIGATVKRYCAATDDLIRLKLQNQAMVAKLEVQNELLKQANEGKSRLISAASHDLRQPVYGMSLMLEKLRSRIRTRVADQDGPGHDLNCDLEFREIERGLRQLGQSISNLLDISRLESGAVTVEISPVSLEDLFSRLMHEFAGQAAIKGIELRQHSTKAYVLADQSLLHSILCNLLVNAITYSNGGKILLGVRRRGSCLDIVVLDQGTGIAPDVLGSGLLFKEYFRASTRQTRASGAGLGLAIASRFAKAMGADIRVDSVLNRGSAFSIRLPRCDAPTTPSRAILLPGGVAIQGFGGLPVMLVTAAPDEVSVVMEMLESNEAMTTCCGTIMEAFMWAAKMPRGVVLVDLDGLDDYSQSVDSWAMLGRIANLTNKMLVAVLVDSADREEARPGLPGVEKCRIIGRSTSVLKLRSILLRETRQRMSEDGRRAANPARRES